MCCTNVQIFYYFAICGGALITVIEYKKTEIEEIYMCKLFVLLVLCVRCPDQNNTVLECIHFFFLRFSLHNTRITTLLCLSVDLLFTCPFICYLGQMCSFIVKLHFLK